MVNPPGNPKSSFMVHESPPATPAEYLESATQHSGSWWPHWVEWLGQRSGGQVKAPQRAGSAEFPPMEDAPGTYVYG
jgi:polyhydroxyalkanoate synthase subunit PhaC